MIYLPLVPFFSSTGHCRAAALPCSLRSFLFPFCHFCHSCHCLFRTTLTQAAGHFFLSPNPNHSTIHLAHRKDLDEIFGN
jgi:hypothetical protein